MGSMLVSYLREFKVCEGEMMFHSDVPAVEKLQLSDLSGFSLDLCEEGVDDADVRHFQELRHRMVQMERADLEQPGTSEGDREAGPLVLPNIRYRDSISETWINTSDDYRVHFTDNSDMTTRVRIKWSHYKNHYANKMCVCACLHQRLYL